MIWGDQWVCTCGTHNLYLRGHCRSCHEKRPDEADLETWRQVLTGRFRASDPAQGAGEHLDPD
jgi:hypothetical protein